MSDSEAATDSNSPSDSSSKETTLLRALGPWMAIAIVIGNVIGSGIYAKPGKIAAEGGNFDLIITVWIAGGILCMLGGLCFAELAVMLPRAGGLYVYLKEAYGKLPAFLYGWQEFLFNRPASTAALSVISVGAIANVTGQTFNPTVAIAMSIALLVGMAAINVFGVVWGGRVQALTTIIKTAYVAFVATLPLYVEFGGTSVIDAANYGSFIELDTSTTTRIAAVLIAVMWAYNGWHGITPVAEEIKQPSRNIPIALLGGIGALIVLYVGANLAYHAVIPMSEMAQPENQEHVAELMVNRLMGPIGGTIMSIGVMLSTLGAINSNMLIGPRIAFAMGRDKVFFSRLGEVHSKFRTPAISIMSQAILGAVLIVASDLLVRNVEYFKETSIFTILTNCIVFVSSIFYLLSVYAVIHLRRTQPDLERPYRTLGYPFVPIVYIVVYVWFLFQIFSTNRGEAYIGIGLLALGAIIYPLFVRGAKSSDSK
jgi:basic amino acid/polyamine antiporter, APA family